MVTYGTTLAEAFANAAYGLLSIIAELDPVEEREARTLEFKEEDSESLLFEWLNGLVYLLDVEMLLFKRFGMTYFDGKQLKAICHGEKYDPS